MKDKPQEPEDFVDIINSEVSWEYPNGFLPDLEDPDPPPRQEPSH